MTPTTFKEYLTLRYSNFLLAAGIAVGLGVQAIIMILAFGDWPEERYEQIINYLGGLALGGGFVMMVVIAFLGLGGPARKLRLGYRDFSIDTEGDE